MSAEPNQPANPAVSPAAPRRKRRWLQYSLRTLFLLMTLSVWPAYQAHVWLKRMQDEDAAIAVLKALPEDWRVYLDRADPLDLDHNLARPPAWFRELVGRDDFANVEKIAIIPRDKKRDRASPPPIDLRILRNFPGLMVLEIDNAWTDSERGLVGLRHLSGLNHLERLTFRSSTLDDGDLAILSGLPAERLTLKVKNCQVRDWAPLGSSRLRALDLEISGNAVGFVLGLEKLSSLERLSLPATAVSDRDAPFVGELPNLMSLTLDGRRVQPDLAKLARLPQLTSLSLHCSSAPCTRLASLRALRNLSHLALNEIELTEDLPAELARLDQLEFIQLRAVRIYEHDPEVRRNRVVQLVKQVTLIGELDLELPITLDAEGKTPPVSELGTHELAALRTGSPVPILLRLEAGRPSAAERTGGDAEVKP